MHFRGSLPPTRDLGYIHLRHSGICSLSDNVVLVLSMNIFMTRHEGTSAYTACTHVPTRQAPENKQGFLDEPEALVAIASTETLVPVRQSRLMTACSVVKRHAVCSEVPVRVRADSHVQNVRLCELQPSGTGIFDGLVHLYE